MAEEQLVTFSLGFEEFGVNIIPRRRNRA